MPLRNCITRYHRVPTQTASRPCWPLVWLWVLSIAQYGYRYILQVNDPRVSLLYGPTPGYLSAIKYGLFGAFVLYSLVCAFLRPLPARPNYRTLSGISLCSLLVLILIFLIRLAVSRGDLAETGLWALQFVPWMMSVFFVPLVFTPAHSIPKTFLAFERLTFWITFPFWVATVGLALYGIRYPALSYPGIIVRFGGILDDPNGYACLCLLLLVLSASIRAGAWRLRSALYVVMLIGTLSLTGYATALTLCLFLLLFRRRPAAPSHVLRRLGVAAAAACLIVAVVAALVLSAQASEIFNSLYSAKTNSAATHLSDLLPDPLMLDASSPLTLLFGAGGFSESFYWRTLLNFGWLGLLAVVALVMLWSGMALSRSRGWRRSLGAWNAGVLIGSNGIAYLLVFPLNLIYWSTLALLMWAGREQPPPASVSA